MNWFSFSQQSLKWLQGIISRTSQPMFWSTGHSVPMSWWSESTFWGWSTVIYLTFKTINGVSKIYMVMWFGNDYFNEFIGRNNWKEYILPQFELHRASFSISVATFSNLSKEIDPICKSNIGTLYLLFLNEFKQWFLNEGSVRSTYNHKLVLWEKTIGIFLELGLK